MALGVEFVAYIVDRKVFLAQGHHQFTYRITGGCRLRAVVDLPEETRLPIVGVSKLVAQDPEGPGGITEPLGGFCRGEAIDEIGPQGLVLAMQGIDGFEEEARFFDVSCYLFIGTYNHIYIVPLNHRNAICCGCYFVVSLYIVIY